MMKLVLLLVSFIASNAMAELVVSDAYARAMPPGQKNSAAYMTLTNTGAQAITLVSAVSLYARSVELHEHRLVDNVMQMRHLPLVTIMPGETAYLEPGGKHLMLFGVNRRLMSGETFYLKLITKNGRRQLVTMPVKAPWEN